MSFARGIGGRMSGRRLLQQAPAFNGNFASLFTPGTVLQSVQSDLGLTYSGIPQATAGNTSTTGLTLTGTLAGPYVPILWKATNTLAVGSGAQFNVFYDGAGVVPSMTGVTPTAGVPVPLTGAGAGLSIAFSAGNAVANDTWKATCSGLADQSGNAVNYSQPTSSKQPLLTTGLSGNPGILFDGVDDLLTSALDLPAPSTTPTCVLGVARVTAFTVNGCLYSENSGLAQIALVEQSSVLLRSQDAALGPSVAYAVGSWFAIRDDYSGAAGDMHRYGSSGTTGSAGTSDPPVGRNIGGTTGLFANCEVLQLLYLNVIPSAAQMAAYYAAVTAKYGGSVQV